MAEFQQKDHEILDVDKGFNLGFILTLLIKYCVKQIITIPYCSLFSVLGVNNIRPHRGFSTFQGFPRLFCHFANDFAFWPYIGFEAITLNLLYKHGIYVPPNIYV